MTDPQKKSSRREFLIQSSQAAAGVVAAGTLASCAIPEVTPAMKGRVIGANERINLAVVGIRSRGMQLAHGFAGMPNVHVKTLVDADENLFADRVKELEKKQDGAPGTAQDLRRVLEDKDIHAIVIAAPNHWHSLATIWACQAGKHVYVEKPCSHNVFEGRKMVEAARKYDTFVSVGFQNRSSKNVRKAMKFLHEGGIGEVYMARGLCFKPRESLGRCPDGFGAGDYDYYVHGSKGRAYDGEYMKGVNYDLWLGPAPERPFNYNRFHYNWHWFWDYGCGDIGNQGPHQFDIARWGLGQAGHPDTVFSEGGYFAFDSAQETPNSQTASFKYKDGKILQFEVRGLYTNGEGERWGKKADGSPEQLQGDVRIGNLFYGTKGWMYLNGTTWKTYLGRKNEPGPSSDTVEDSADPMNFAGAGGGNHFANFIYALRSGKRSDLTSEIEEGHISSALPHLANISYRVGRHLRFDGAKEKFMSDREADRLLTRNYRAPYVVPEKSMSVIEKQAYGRAGLLGNPSDGYKGKILAVTVKNFGARVELRPSKALCIEHWDRALNVYDSLPDLVGRIRLHGYYEGERLIKAGIKKFCDHCDEAGIKLAGDNFTLRYQSTIPRQIGLAGSSAIITATLRALMEFFEVKIPLEIQPNLILAAEFEELGINAGLMDRVIQVYEGCMYMDFSPEIMDRQGHGAYEPVDVKLLPDLYIAYDPNLGKVSGQVLNDIRTRFDEGDPFVIGTLKRIASLAEEGRQALLDGDAQKVHRVMDENFDLRGKIMNITEGNRKLVDTARACGASAKFTGSGGSIIGVYHGEEMFSRLKQALEALGAVVIKPLI